jgi:hypothetical protein
LRPGNVDGAKGARNVIRSIIRAIHARCPKVKILVRGDSGFARENLMRWCENNRVDFLFGLARNGYLLHKACKIKSRAAVTMVDSDAPWRSSAISLIGPNPEAGRDRDRSSTKPCTVQLTSSRSASSSPHWIGTPRW